MRWLLVALMVVGTGCNCGFLPVDERGDAGEPRDDSGYEEPTRDAGGLLLQDAGVVQPSDGGAWWYRFRAAEHPSGYQFVTALGVDLAAEAVWVAGRGEPVGETGASTDGTGVMFLSKFSGGGQALWSRRFGESGGAEVEAIVPAPNGDVLLVGDIMGNPGSIRLGGQLLGGLGGSDVFAARVSPSGELLWAVAWGSTSYDRVGGAALRSTGELVVVSQVAGGVELRELAGDGNEKRVRVVASGVGINASNLSPVRAVTLDGNGNVLVAGQTRAGANFGEGPLTASRFEQGFLASYDGAFERRWVRTFVTNGGNSVVGSGLWMVGVGIVGADVVLAGGFPGQVDFGGGALQAATFNPMTAFVARYDAQTGVHRGSWALPGISRVFSVSPAPGGALALSAEWVGRPVLDGFVLPDLKGPGVLRLGAAGGIASVRPLVEFRRPDPNRDAAMPARLRVDGAGRIVFLSSFLAADTLTVTRFDDLKPYDALVVSVAP